MDILTMNQNVFGSSFETTRRTNFTENAINSELIIPTSAVELSYEEMEYVDGGFFLGVHISVNFASTVYNFMNNLGDVIDLSSNFSNAITYMTPFVAATAIAKEIQKSIIMLNILLDFYPVVGQILKVIGVAASLYFGSAYVAGAFGRGYKIGFEVGLFKIKPVGELL